jgi:hypothetical protein
MRRLPAAVMLVGASVLSCGCAMRHTLGREAIQAQLAAQFPVEKSAALWAVRIEDPVLRLDGKANRIGLELTVTAAGLAPDGKGVGMRSITGRAGVEGRIEYRAKEGAFYLMEPTITRLSFSEVPIEVEVPLRMAAEAMLKVVLRERPIYVLDAKRSEKEALIKSHVDRVWVEGDGVVVEFHL